MATNGLQYVIAAMTEIEKCHKFVFRDAAHAVTADDLNMFSQLKKATRQCSDRYKAKNKNEQSIDQAAVREEFQSVLRKIMFPSRAELPPVAKVKQEQQLRNQPTTKGAGSKVKLNHQGTEFNENSFLESR